MLARRRWLVAGTLLAVLALIGGSFALAQSRRSLAPTRLTIEATPIAAFDDRDRLQTRFGTLEFRGGLALTSKYEAFGGISAIHVAPDGGAFIAVTDKGSWLAAASSIATASPPASPMPRWRRCSGRTANGSPRAAGTMPKSLTAIDGMVYVGIERANQIVRFNYARDGLLARGEPMAVPSDFKTLAHNQSMECLAAPPKASSLAGSLIVITERSLDAAGNHRSFLLKGDQVERFSVKRSDDYDVSDCAILPSADLLLLECRFSFVSGVALRIRRIPLAGIKPDTLVDGKPLIEADLGYQIDNMEGIAVHRNARHETVITLVSDDNFSVLQRNLLLQFTLPGE